MTDLFGHLHQLGGVAYATAHQLALARAKTRTVLFAGTIRLAEPGRKGIVVRLSRRQSFLAAHHCRIRGQPCLGRGDGLAQLALTID
ncbi:MAG: hypothetical protein E6J12_03140 [Chloroflexi bacterium]|nr:MAG: hypothetical protein E6J12_03140 [Chloroflexota bacterium]